MNPWLLGVDAGGSRTTAVLWRHGCDEVLTAEAGPGNPWSVGSEFAADAIEQACAQVLALGGLHLHEVGQAVLGIAGYGRSGAPEGFAERIEMWGLPSGAIVTSDLDIATVAGLGDTPGMHVVCGTGSAVMVQIAAGQRLPLGGWGWFLGDAGSAFDLGRRALRCWAASSDDDALPSSLEQALAEYAGEESPRALQGRLANPGRQRAWIAGLARVVLQEAENGEGDALKMMDEGIADLVPTLERGRRKLPAQKPLNLSFSGGMFRSSVFTNSFKSHLAKLGLEAPIVNQIPIPVVGALRLAEKSLGLIKFENLNAVIACHFA